MEKAEESIGRFSALPDDVVRHILSFLPTKFSVATSILAKRWRFLWTHVPNLVLDSSYHQRGTTFSKFVNRVMLLHKVKDLYNFRLSCINRSNCSNYELETWIMTAIARNVRNFDLSLCFPLRLPQCLFTWKTLVSLSLHYSVVVPSRFSGTICLSSLKKLHLYYASYPSDEALSHLLSGCPVLEELSIINNTVNVNQDLRCFNISSRTIKRLTMSFGRGYHEGNVKINAPSLRYLKIHDLAHNRLSVSPMTSLIEADICSKTYSLKDGHYIPSSVDFLDRLCNVTCLKLAGYYEEEKIIDLPSSVLRFDNLTKLELKLTADWRLLVKLLESADNLKVLIVDMNLISWKEPKRVPTCLLLHLRTVRIGPIVCGKHEFNMVRYLVRNAKVLEKMELRFVHCLKAKLDVVRRILLFERGSETCELAFYGGLLRG